MLYQKVFILVVLIFVVVAAGCKSTAYSTITSTFIPDDTLTPSLKQTKTSNTLTPTTITPDWTQTKTLTKTTTPTFTAVPKLPRDEAQLALQLIINSNGGCELPCIWSITPGETTWVEVRNLLAPIVNFKVGEYYPGVYKYTINPDDLMELLNSGSLFIPPSISVVDGVVQEITFEDSFLSPSFDLSISSILKKFGQPDKIWMEFHYIAEAEPLTVTYKLILHFSTQGVTVSLGDKALVKNHEIKICPQRVIGNRGMTTVFYSWIPENEEDFLNRNSIINSVSIFPIEDYLEDFNEITFFTTFEKPTNQNCIETTIEIIEDLYLND